MNATLTPAIVESPIGVDPRSLDPVSVHINVAQDFEHPERESFVVSPDPFVAVEQQAICWRAERPFTVQFQDESPIEARAELRASDRGEWFEVCVRARADASRAKRYKYSVAIGDNEGQIQILDPGGVVEPDPRKKT